MSRDHKKLRVFSLADELVAEVYRCTVKGLLGGREVEPVASSPKPNAMEK